MVRVGIVGASGYTGAELARLLCRHPEVEITAATTRQHAGKPLTEVYPHLKGRVDVVCSDPPADELASRADLFFTAVPHQTAMEIVPKLLEHGCKVIDLSADFRIRDAAVYEAWYQKHTAADLLPQAVYGLPELHREAIRGTALVANPGCYPTSVILALSPLLQAGLIRPETIVIDSKSGTSGAGRSAQVGTLFCEVTDGFRAYKVGEHRHTPEIEQELSRAAGLPVTVTFTPHLLPVSRGILSTIYAQVAGEVAEDAIRGQLQDFYRSEPFVRVLAPGQVPATQYVRGSNFCDIGLKLDRRTGRLIVLSAIDNLVKGAAGQAVQNMNLLAGFPETTGLEQAPLFP